MKSKLLFILLLVISSLSFTTVFGDNHSNETSMEESSSSSYQFESWTIDGEEMTSEDIPRDRHDDFGIVNGTPVEIIERSHDGESQGFLEGSINEESDISKELQTSTKQNAQGIQDLNEKISLLLIVLISLFVIIIGLIVFIVIKIKK